MRKRIISVMLVLTMLLTTMLSGCASTDDGQGNTPDVAIGAVENQVEIETSLQVSTDVSDEIMPTEAELVLETETTEPVAVESALTTEQKNSVNMLNYLMALVTEINASTGSRVYLQDAYMELFNNTDPGVVDEFTSQQYAEISDLLEGYRMIEVKRERLSYIYEQNNAAAIRSAMPDPLSILNVIQSGNALKVLVSSLYLAVDSVSSYNEYTTELDMQYLQEDWALSDEEAKYLHNSRKSMFGYMTKITNNYDVPGVMTLSEEYATEFTKWKNDPNIIGRIRWMESKEETYRYFGEYWLCLAESYYLNKNYDKCLDAITAYEELEIAIYRQDYKYAEALPYAVIAAKETMDVDGYVRVAEKYAELILSNASWYDWAKQYFVCQTYVELYSLTQSDRFLQRAYDIALDTVNYLVKEQKSLNENYLSKLEEKKVNKKDNATVKQQKEEYNNYIEYVKEVRETEVPPVYEPLRLFCELLFGLAEEINLSAEERQYAESILRGSDTTNKENVLFLDQTLENLFTFDNVESDVLAENISVEFNGKTIEMPAQYVSSASHIVLRVDGDAVVDWKVKEVDRDKNNNIEKFTVTFTSENVRDLKFKDGSIVTIELFPYENAEEHITFDFEVDKLTILWFITLSTKFVRQ